MSPEERRFEAYKIAIATRNFEIDLFWKRSLFFWGFIATAALAYGGIKQTGSHSLELSIIVGCFGTICSLAWSAINRGSKFWQEQWEEKVNALENQFPPELKIFNSLVSKKQNGWLSAKDFSVSKVAIGLSDYVSFLWILVLSADIFTLFEITATPDEFIFKVMLLATIVVICRALFTRVFRSSLDEIAEYPRD